MKYKFERCFEKDFTKLKNKQLAQTILNVIQEIADAQNIQEVKNIKKLKGCSSAYRIRIGDYRIGFFMEDDVVIFTAFDHRKDIYKTFP